MITLTNEEGTILAFKTKQCGQTALLKEWIKFYGNKTEDAEVISIETVPSSENRENHETAAITIQMDH